MKWEQPHGSVRHTACGRYCVMKANSEDWVAYELSSFGTTAQKLGERKSEQKAQGVCESREAQLTAEHRRPA